MVLDIIIVPAPIKIKILLHSDGQALCRERFDIDQLTRIRKSLGEYFFGALYQQRPSPSSGGIFETERFAVLPARPAAALVVKRVRYWDKAASEGKGDWSAGVLMALLRDGRYVVEDVVRGRWSAGQRETILKQTAHRDGPTVDVWVEQEPGSGGKESAQNTVRNLAGFVARADRVTGEKVTRARPFAAQVEAGNCAIVAGPWNRDFLEELALFDHGDHDDQVDAASGAFNKLAGAPVPVAPRTNPAPPPADLPTGY